MTTQLANHFMRFDITTFIFNNWISRLYKEIIAFFLIMLFFWHWKMEREEKCLRMKSSNLKSFKQRWTVWFYFRHFILVFYYWVLIKWCAFLTPALLAALRRKPYVLPGSRLCTVHSSSWPWCTSLASSAWGANISKLYAHTALPPSTWGGADTQQQEEQI